MSAPILRSPLVFDTTWSVRSIRSYPATNAASASRRSSLGSGAATGMVRGATLNGRPSRPFAEFSRAGHG